VQLILILFAVFVVIAVIGYVVVRAQRQAPGGPPAEDSGSGKLPYRLKDSLLSPAERSFYGVLYNEASALGLQVFVQLRLSDLFFVPRQERTASSYRAKIQQKSVDFVLCDRDRVAPVLGIELDDRSHERSDRRVRDVRVEQVFADAGLPLVRFPVKQGYVVTDVHEKLLQALGRASNADHAVVGDATDLPDRTPPANSLPKDADRCCPKCGSGLVERSGRARGRFLACPNFPNCRHTEPLATDTVVIS
jgi:hypothetical protein